MEKFYRCKHCGNIVGMVYASGVKVVCCGEEMEPLIPNSVDAAKEKHVPVVKVEGNTVSVVIGSVLHPMSEAHHIAWIYVETSMGGERRVLTYNGKPEAMPKATFTLQDQEKLVAVYAYCNLHGLWKYEL